MPGDSAVYDIKVEDIRGGSLQGIVSRQITVTCGDRVVAVRTSAEESITPQLLGAYLTHLGEMLKRGQA